MKPKLLNSCPRLDETNSPLFAKASLLERVPSPTGERLRCRGVFQAIGKKNENNRIYPMSVWNRNLGEGSDLVRRINERMVLGELEHPESGMTHLTRVSHLIDNASIEHLDESNEFEVEPGDYVVGELTCLNTPYGQIARELYDVGVKVGISSRGRGDVSPDDDGVDVVEDNYDCDTWDLVYEPSVGEARTAPIKEDQECDSITKLMEDAKKVVAAAQHLEESDTLTLVELGSQLSSITSHLSRLTEDKQTDELKEARSELAKQTKQIVTRLRSALGSRESSSPLVEKEKRIQSQKRRSTKVSTKAEQVVAEIADRLVKKQAENTELQAKVVELGKSGPEEDGQWERRYERLQKKYDLVANIGGELLKRARLSEAKNLELSEQLDAATTLAHELREKLVKGERRRVRRKPNESRRRSRSERAPAKKQTTESKKDTKVVDPVGKLRRRQVQEDVKKPKTLIRRVSERCDNFDKQS